MSVRVSGLALSLAAGSLCLIAGSNASAQSFGAARDASVDYFSRNRNVSVQARPRPDFEAAGIRTGSFLLFPRLDVVGEYNDNIYADSTGEVDDVIAHVRPEISFESDWNQHFLTGYARASLNRYKDRDTENTDEFGAGLSGRLNVTRFSNIAAGATYLSSFEPRTAPNSPAGVVEPIDLDISQAYVSASRTGGRIKLSGRGDWRSYDYKDGRSPTNTVVEQDTRDRQAISGTARIDYAVSPDTALFFQATANERIYDIASTVALPNRDSSGQEYLAGASFEAGALVRGEVSVGYIHQDFDETAYQDVSGFGGRAQLEWFVTELTTVTALAGRTVEDAVNPDTGGYLSTSAGVTIDHELLRNVILTGSLTYSNDVYEGIDREDDRVSASVGATYLVNRNFGVNASVSSVDTTSAGLNADDDFRVNKLSLSLVGQF